MHKDIWKPNVFEQSYFLKHLRAFWPAQPNQQWPSIADYNQRYQTMMSHHPCWQRVKFIEQALMPHQARYETHIYFNHEIPTRPFQWHDFLNFLTWMEWPHAKRALNRRMTHEFFKHPENRYVHRNSVQNRLALLDECGLVICAKPEMLTCIRQHQWWKLFVQNATSFQDHIKVYVFGHGLYEKCLNPYIGLTGHAWLVSKVLSQSEADKAFAHWLEEPSSLRHKSCLNPFPMLGVPGAWSKQDDAFYQKAHYFRPKNHAKAIE